MLVEFLFIVVIHFGGWKMLNFVVELRFFKKVGFALLETLTLI